jgi:hypothetical protein
VTSAQGSFVSKTEQSSLAFTARVVKVIFSHFQVGHNHANDPATTKPQITVSNKYFAVVDQGCPYQILIGTAAQPKARKPAVETKRNTTM